MLKFILVSSFLIAFCLGAATKLRRPRLDGRIVGGRDADISEVPYQLSFEYGGKHICGASILSYYWVVTAGHCAYGKSATNVRFRAGSSNRGSGGSLHQASKVIVHPQYNYYTKDFDVAVIKVTQGFIYSNTVQPIILSTVEPSAGIIATVTGWGTLSSGGSLPLQLQLVTIPIVDRNACAKAYAAHGGITKSMICAGVEEGGRDSCQGDSGGPLVTGGKLSGIVSWGAGCASPGYPGVYANVASFINFIISSINNN